MKLVPLTFLILALSLPGCSSSNSQSLTPSPDKSSNNKAAIHKATECPENIEGIYEGQSDSGKKMIVEFYKNQDKVLVYRLTLEGDEANSTAVPVDGQKHTFSGLDPDSYISAGCEKAMISSFSSYKGQESEGRLVFNDEGFNAEAVPQKQNVRKFKKILRPNLKITILADDKLSKITADPTDNPPNYVSLGKLVPRASAVATAKNGMTLCYIRSRFYQPKTGEVLKATSNNGGIQDGQINYRTIAHESDVATVLSVTCFSSKGPLSDEDVIANVNGSGIVKIAP